MAGAYLNLKVLGPALFNRLITFSELSGSVDTKNVFGNDARSFKAWGTSSIMGLAPWAQRLSESFQKSN